MAQSTKWSKKSKEADVSLEVHDSTNSPDDVSDCPSLCFLCDPYTHAVFAFTGTDEEIRRLGH
jgi:hypothetical protein